MKATSDEEGNSEGAQPMYCTSFYLRLSILAVIQCALSIQGVRAAVPSPANHAEVASIDQRLAAKQPLLLAPERVAALDQARARIPDLQVDFDEIVGSPKWIRVGKGIPDCAAACH
jgi:hypothetical protein